MDMFPQLRLNIYLLRPRRPICISLQKSVSLAAQMEIMEIQAYAMYVKSDDLDNICTFCTTVHMVVIRIKNKKKQIDLIVITNTSTLVYVYVTRRSHNGIRSHH